MRYIFQIDFPRVVLLAIVAVIAFAGDRDEIIAISICCIPLYSSLQYTSAVSLCIIAYVLKFGGDLRINGSVIIILVLATWELLHCFNDSFSVVQFIAHFVPLVLCGLLMCCPTEERNYPFIVRVLAVCTLFICVLALSKCLIAANLDLQSAFDTMSRLGVSDDDSELVGAYFNPNTLGFFCILGAVGVLQLAVMRKQRKSDIVLAVLILGCGVLTMSLTYFACLLLMAGLLVLSNKGSVLEKIKLLVALAVVVLAIVAILYAVFPAAFSYLGRRVATPDISNGRGELFILFLEYSLSTAKNLFFGIGLHDFGAKISQSVNVQVPHNGFQEVLLAWGIPGFILFLLFLVEIIRRGHRECSTQGLINYIPLILILTKVQVGQMITIGYIVLMFSVAYLSLCYNFIKEEKANVNRERCLRRRKL